MSCKMKQKRTCCLLKKSLGSYFQRETVQQGEQCPASEKPFTLIAALVSMMCCLKGLDFDAEREECLSRKQHTQQFIVFHRTDIADNVYLETHWDGFYSSLKCISCRNFFQHSLGGNCVSVLFLWLIMRSVISAQKPSLASEKISFVLCYYNHL